MPGNRQALRIVCLGLLLAFASSLLLKIFSPRAELAENNLQANLIRIQSFLFDPPPRALLVGSSMTGRLLPRYFNETPLAPIGNLGLDGSGPVLGLELAAQRPPPVLLVEINLLLKPWTPNDSLLQETCQSPAFRVSRHVSLLRAQSRPSSILYSWLKTRTNRGQSPPPPPSEFNLIPPGKTLEEAKSLDTMFDYEQIKKQIHSLIKKLHIAGSKLVLVRMPAGKNSLRDDHPAVLFANELAAEFQLAQVNLAGELGSTDSHISYTDGVHLTPASALKASHLLASDLVKAGLLPDRQYLEKTQSKGVLAEKLRPTP